MKRWHSGSGGTRTGSSIDRVVGNGASRGSIDGEHMEGSGFGADASLNGHFSTNGPWTLVLWSCQIGWSTGSSWLVNVTNMGPHDTSLRKEGIGSTLLRAAIDAARAARAQLCTLHVDERNEPARALYGRMGFAATSRRDDYYKPGRHAFAMELELAS